MILTNILVKMTAESGGNTKGKASMLILSVSEAKRQIKDLVAQTGLRNQVFYITRYSRPKAVMMSVEQYESLVRQVSQLQGDLARVWAALDAPTGADAPILLPTPDGGTRLFQPRRPVTPEVREAIRRAGPNLPWHSAIGRRSRSSGTERPSWSVPARRQS